MIRRSPLEGIALGDGLRELAFRAQLDLRLDADDAGETRGAVEWGIGALPTEPEYGAHGGADAAVLWLGPDEWLIVGPPRRRSGPHGPGSPRAPGPRRDASPSSRLGQADDARARGPRSHELFELGCPVDLRPRASVRAARAQTLLARANLLISHVADEPDDTWRLSFGHGSPPTSPRGSRTRPTASSTDDGQVEHAGGREPLVAGPFESSDHRCRRQVGVGANHHVWHVVPQDRSATRE